MLKSTTLFILLVLPLIASCSWWSEKHKKTSYEISCPLNDGPPAFELSPRHYEIIKSQQIAILYLVGNIIKYEDCSIFDENNWTCSKRGGSISVSMRNGKFVPKYEINSFDNRVYVHISGVKYRLLNFKNRIFDNAYGKFCKNELKRVALPNSNEQ